MSERLTGKVKFFNTKRGFGFITTGSVDVFVHVSALPEKKPLIDGQEVQYELGKDKQGLKMAINVQPA